MTPLASPPGEALRAAPVQVGVGLLTIEDVARVARGGERVAPLEALGAAGIAELTQDRAPYPDIRKAVCLVRDGALVRAAREAAGGPAPC
jgi:hypothetical protein